MVSVPAGRRFRVIDPVATLPALSVTVATGLKVPETSVGVPEMIPLGEEIRSKGNPVILHA